VSENTSKKISEIRGLIVEDAGLISRVIAAVLKNIGVVTVAAVPFDFIVCDWSMPNMDGLQFLKWFRARQAKTPFVMLTAKTGPQEFHQAKIQGVDYFLMKPLSHEDLQLRLKGVIDTLAGQGVREFSSPASIAWASRFDYDLGKSFNNNHYFPGGFVERTAFSCS